MRVAARGTAAGTGKSDTTSVFALEGEAQAPRRPLARSVARCPARCQRGGARHPRPPPSPAPARPSGSSASSTRRATPATIIDWRRSASSDHLYVREREWEAAHTFWLWPDVSPSMAVPQPPGADRQARPRRGADAGLRRAAGARGRAHRPDGRDAAAGQPQGQRAHRRGAGHARVDPALQASLPPPARLSRFSTALLFSDFLDPPRGHRPAHQRAGGRRRQRPSRAGARSGRGDAGLRGPHGVPRAGRRRALGRRSRRDVAPAPTRRSSPRTAPRSPRRHSRVGWSFLVHHTDRPAAEPLLTLTMRLQGLAGDYRWKSEGRTRRAQHDARADRVPQSVAAGRRCWRCRSSGGCCARCRRSRGASRSRRPASWSASRTARRRRRRRPGG